MPDLTWLLFFSTLVVDVGDMCEKITVTIAKGGMDEDAKRKRVRKRVRKGKGDVEHENEEAQEPGPSRQATTKQQAAIQPAVEGKGPTLSFYQRTNPHKPSALNSLTGSAPRRYTVSVAIPGNIIMNAQTPELQARLAGQIARSCAIFNVDEIVVFDEGRADEVQTSSYQQRGAPSYGTKRRWNDDQTEDVEEEQDGDGSGGKPRFDPNAFLARILQYVETPQYLRKALFPMHRDLRLAGLLAPLDCPHHLRFEDRSAYREGVIVDGQGSTKNVCYVDVGHRDPVACALARSTDVPIGARVTVRMPAGSNNVGQLVSPREPVERKGVYWGYAVRLCASLSHAISQSTFARPYDFVVGTSERGQSLTGLIEDVNAAARASPDAVRTTDNVPTSFQHALIVLGGLSGLEVAVERDPGINASADEAHELFDAWVNVVEGQGSRTIRTEEALLITLARLKPLLETLGSAN